MARVNIVLNNKNYFIEESSFADATAELKQHLSTTMSGSGSVINLGGVAYSIDSTKLASATSDFVSSISGIAGSGSKVIIGGVEYSLDSAKIQEAISELETALGDLQGPEVVIILDEAILDYSILG